MKAPAAARALLMIPCLLTAAALAADPVALRASLGPIAIGDTRDDVQKKIGAPASAADDERRALILWRYAGLDIYFQRAAPQRVMQIVTTDPRFCTTSGVCPGSSLSQVVGRLGVPREVSMAMDGISTFAVDVDTCWLEVDLQDSAAGSLAIRCQP